MAGPERSEAPAEIEEDGQYVLVDDKRAVEINRAVDGASFLPTSWPPLTSEFLEITARRRPLRDHKPTSPLAEGSPTSPYPVFESPEAPAPISFPPPPNPNAPPLSGSPSSVGSRTGSNALTRALNAASKKLFGSSNSLRSSPHYREYTSTPRRQQIISSRGGLGLDVDGVKDPSEDALLESLEELAQKTDVLGHWADEMYEFAKAAPESEFVAFVLRGCAILTVCVQSHCSTRRSSSPARASLHGTRTSARTRLSRRNIMP